MAFLLRVCAANAEGAVRQRQRALALVIRIE